MDLILSQDELVAITGYKVAGKQANWMRLNGITARISAVNRCIVFRADLPAREPAKPPRPKLHLHTA